MFRPAADVRRLSPRWLVAVLLVGLSLRVAWCLIRPVDDASLNLLPDQVEYLSAARSILAGDGLSFTDSRFDQVVVAYRMPGYPLMCAALGASPRAMLLFQAVVDTSTILATVLLARLWLSPAISLFAGALVALNPWLVYFCGLLLTESIFTAILAWAMLCLARGATPLDPAGGGHARRLWWIGVGLLIVSIYFRPSAIVFPVVIAVASLLAHSWPRMVRRVPIVTIVAGLTIAALLPWASRNRVEVGRWVFTTTNTGFTFYDGLHAGADGSSDQRFVADLPILNEMNEVQRSNYLLKSARSWAFENPGRVWRLGIAKIGRLWSPVPLSDAFGSKPRYVLIAAGFSVPVFALVLIAFWRRSMPIPALIFLLSVAALTTLLHAITVGSVRYRVPVEPQLAIVAAAALARRGSSFQHAKHG
jgi:4-amino-4-deoxy-L-arabinose transferase-like glycosyltransferase